MTDQTTLDLMAAIDTARIAGSTEPHTSNLRELARITNEMLTLDARRRELQASITAINAAYTDAEVALGTHLATKHRATAPASENLASGDPEAIT